MIDTLDLPGRRLGYAFRAAQENPRYVVYAEQPLPEQRTGAPPASGAFREIDYALYLGTDGDEDDLL